MYSLIVLLLLLVLPAVSVILEAAFSPHDLGIMGLGKW